MADWDSALSSAPKAAPTPRAGDWDAALSTRSEFGPTLSRVPRAQDRSTSKRYDPEVATESYIWNELKKVPGGLFGLAPDAVEWISRKAIGAPTDFGNVTRKLQSATGADPTMRPPGPGSERLGILAQNVAGSVPFAAGAVPARGVLGAATELISGLGGGVGQVTAKEMAGSGSPIAEIAGNVAGSAAGFRAGSILETGVAIGKMAFNSMASKEARAASALKARGIMEGTPEYQQALAGQMQAAKGEILGDLSKAYAQEDMSAVSKLLDNYDIIKQKMPGFKASVGEVTGNESALAMQSKLESRNIPGLEERGARIRANEKAIRDARANLVPSVSGAGRAAMRDAQSTLDAQLRALGEREAALGADLSEQSSRMAGTATPLAEAGGALKAASKEDYLASRGLANRKYREFRASLGDDAPIDVSNVITKLNELEAKFVFDKQPEVLGLIKGAANKTTKDGQAALGDFNGESLMQVIRKKGGIDISEIRDLTGESRAGRGIPGMPVNFYTKNGKTLDNLASELRDEGWLIPDDAVDGGVQNLRDLIQAEINGEKQYSIADTDRMIARQYEQKVQGQANDFFGAGNKLTIAELDDLASVANRDIQRERSKSNPDRKAIAQLMDIKEEAKGTIEIALFERGDKDALSKYQEANRYFGQEHAPKYLTGVNLKLRMKDAVGEERVKPESVVAAYFKPNGTTEGQRFNTQFAENGAAKETLARGVFDLYKKEVIDAGGGAVRHDFFVRKYAAPLAEYPWIAKRIEKNVVGGEIAKRMEEVRAQRGEVATSDLAKVLGTRDVDRFIGKAMQDKRFMLSALSKMDQVDRKNMAIAVLNKAWDEGAHGSTAVNKFLDNEDNLKMLMRFGFGPAEGSNHLNNVKLLAQALKINESAPKTSPMTALSEDSLKGLTGTSWLQVMSALRAVGRRPGSGDWFAMVFGGQFIKAKIDKQKIEILKEQLFDPQLLQATLQEARKRNFGAVGAIGEQVTSRVKQFSSKLWDLTKAIIGAGAPTAAAKRLPVAAVSAQD